MHWILAVEVALGVSCRVMHTERVTVHGTTVSYQRAPEAPTPRVKFDGRTLIINF